MSGWVFIAFGVLLGAGGAFLVYYGQDMVRRDGMAASEAVLTPQQERLLGIIHKHQRELGLPKLIIGRDGVMAFDPPRAGPAPNLARELYGPTPDPSHLSEFGSLIDSMPEQYVRRFPETRYGSPFVVAITDAGTKYLRR